MSFLANLYASVRYPTPQEDYDLPVDVSPPPDGDDNLAACKSPDDPEQSEVVTAPTRKRAPRKRKT